MKRMTMVMVLAGMLMGGALVVGQEPARVAMVEQRGQARTADPRVETYRKDGQAGLDRLLQEHAELIAAQTPKLRQPAPPKFNFPVDGQELPRTEQGTGEWEQTRDLIDAVAGQRDGWSSRLFWHDSLEAAQAAAAKSGKPILQLHMLGKLTDEVSCANSRYFRTTVYSDPTVSGYLRDNFELCWATFRPVPVMTVDYGDGRRIERTVTGNSAHQVLDAKGRVVDVLPGLYSAAAFKTGLERAHAQAVASVELQNADLTEALSTYHAALDKVLVEAMDKDIAAVKDHLDMNSLDPEEQQWAIIARLPHHDVQLSPESVSLVSMKSPPSAEEVMRIAMSKSMVETPLVRMTRNLQNSIAIDTVKNEYLLHAAVHRWYIMETAPLDPIDMRNRVYTELFMMPPNDPWLGMAPPDTYSALPGNGLTEAPPHMRIVSGVHPPTEEKSYPRTLGPQPRN
jgi:hypothetical protein